MKVEEVIQPINHIHVICVGQEVHRHYGVNHWTAHPLVVPGHYSTAAEGNHRCLQQVSHRPHAIVGKVFQDDHIVADRGL